MNNHLGQDVSRRFEAMLRPTEAYGSAVLERNIGLIETGGSIVEKQCNAGEHALNSGKLSYTAFGLPIMG